MSSFRQNVSFFAVDWLPMHQLKGKAVARALDYFFSMVNEEGTIRPVAPITVCPVSDFEEALGSIQAGIHLGKIVKISFPLRFMLTKIVRFYT